MTTRFTFASYPTFAGARSGSYEVAIPRNLVAMHHSRFASNRFLFAPRHGTELRCDTTRIKNADNREHDESCKKGGGGGGGGGNGARAEIVVPRVS